MVRNVEKRERLVRIDMDIGEIVGRMRRKWNGFRNKVVEMLKSKGSED